MPITLEAPSRVAIPGWPGYAVDRDGTVWSARTYHGEIGDTWRALRPRADKDGYLSVVLYERGRRKTVRVAHLVLGAFVGPRPPGAESCHWPDVDVTNNAARNLRWDSHRSNSQDKVTGGTVARGEGHGQARLTEADVLALRADRGAGLTYAALGRKYGISTTHAGLIVTGRYWSHVGNDR